MRKKISIGFISLALVLLLAGAVSVYELQRLRNQSEEIVSLNLRNTELADRMMTALQSQNSAILRMILSEATTPDAGYELGRAAFDEALKAASVTEEDATDLAAVRTAHREYREIVTVHLADDGTADIDWFLAIYLPAYYHLDAMLKDYLSSPANSLPARAQMLEKSVYKTITPSILTLLIAIIIVLMFYFFVDSYYVRPVIRIHKSLKNYLAHGIPFAPKFESNDDEIEGLKEMIDELAERKKTEPK